MNGLGRIAAVCRLGPSHGATPTPSHVPRALPDQMPTVLLCRKDSNRLKTHLSGRRIPRVRTSPKLVGCLVSHGFRCSREGRELRRAFSDGGGVPRCRCAPADERPYGLLVCEAPDPTRRTADFPDRISSRLGLKGPAGGCMPPKFAKPVPERRSPSSEDEPNHAFEIRGEVDHRKRDERPIQSRLGAR